MPLRRKRRGSRSPWQKPGDPTPAGAGRSAIPVAVVRIPVRGRPPALLGDLRKSLSGSLGARQNLVRLEVDGDGLDGHALIMPGVARPSNPFRNDAWTSFYVMLRCCYEDHAGPRRRRHGPVEARSQARELFESESSAAFAPPDAVLFRREDTLLAQRLDLRALEPTGDPFPGRRDGGAESPHICHRRHSSLCGRANRLSDGGLGTAPTEYSIEDLPATDRGPPMRRPD